MSAKSSLQMLSWRSIQSVFDPDPQIHWQHAGALGLICPEDPFEQLFHEHHDTQEFANLLRWVDWSHVRWEAVDLSGVALRQVSAPRDFQYAVDEARERTREVGIQDDRQAVLDHWVSSGTWFRAPVLIAGDVLESALRFEVLVGFTRLGNLLGMLDRQALPESDQHRVWLASVDRS